IGKCVWDVLLNSFHEQIKTRIENQQNQEEKIYINTLKSTVENATESVESSKNGETNLMTKRFSKFLICRRKTNLNFAGSKGHSRKQDLKKKMNAEVKSASILNNKNI
ncbi:hypothetical protein V8G54_020726, partial [Vigna mungo]